LKKCAVIPRALPQEGDAGDGNVPDSEGVDGVSSEALRRANNELKRFAGSLEHMMTHEPKKPFCSVCNRAKTQRKPKVKGTLKLGPKPTEFGEQVTGDLLIKNKRNVTDVIIDDEGEVDERPNEADLDVSDLANSALVLYDRGTQWLECYPKASRSHEHIVEAMQDFTKPTDNIQQFYCDNGGELESASRQLGWRRPTSTPGVPQTNGLAERCIRKVKEGGASGVVQSGFKGKWWWKYADKHYTAFKNIAIVDGDSSYNRRHKNGHFPGENFSFGSRVDFLPTPGTKRDGFDEKTMVGLFVGYHFLPGGIWSGDYLVVELEPLFTILMKHRTRREKHECTVSKRCVNTLNPPHTLSR